MVREEEVEGDPAGELAPQLGKSDGPHAVTSQFIRYSRENKCILI